MGVVVQGVGFCAAIWEKWNPFKHLVSDDLICFLHCLIPFKMCSWPQFHVLYEWPSVAYAGFKLLLDVCDVVHGSQEECVKALKNGHLLAIAPGGVREALFSNENYPLLWENRKGFAQVAIDAKVVSEPFWRVTLFWRLAHLAGVALHCSSKRLYYLNMTT